MQFESYTAPERGESDSYSPKDHVGNLLIVKVLEHKHIEKTPYKPEGGPGVIAEVCDLTSDGAVFRDVLWMGGAVVDGLKQYVGRGPLVIKFAMAKSNAGRDYVTIEAAAPDELAQAQAYVSANGDPFAPVLSTPELAAAGAMGGFGGAAAPPF